MILSDSDVCDIRATKSGLSGGVSVPQFIGDSEAAQTITVSGIEFEITAKEHLDSDKTATILVIGSEWEKGTMRKFSQQIFLSRYMKKADMAAGVEGDRNLKDGEWVVRAKIEEMKGQHIERVGSVHDIARISNGKFEFIGLEWLM